MRVPTRTDAVVIAAAARRRSSVECPLRRGLRASRRAQSATGRPGSAGGVVNALKTNDGCACRNDYAARKRIPGKPARVQFVHASARQIP
jgi:hypothetical protein